MTIFRQIKLRLATSSQSRFYDITITQDNSLWKTLVYFGPIGQTGTVKEIYSGSSVDNAILKGERQQRELEADGYKKIFGSLRRS